MFRVLIIFVLTSVVLMPSGKAQVTLVWPPAPDTARIAFVGEIRCDDLKPDKGLLGSVARILGGTADDEKLSHPFDLVAIDGNIYMTCQTTVKQQTRRLGVRHMITIFTPSPMRVTNFRKSQQPPPPYLEETPMEVLRVATVDDAQSEDACRAADQQEEKEAGLETHCDGTVAETKTPEGEENDPPTCTCRDISDLGKDQAHFVENEVQVHGCV